jgi:hypothetical protein
MPCGWTGVGHHRPELAACGGNIRETITEIETCPEPRQDIITKGEGGVPGTGEARGSDGYRVVQMDARPLMKRMVPWLDVEQESPVSATFT